MMAITSVGVSGELYLSDKAPLHKGQGFTGFFNKTDGKIILESFRKLMLLPQQPTIP